MVTLTCCKGCSEITTKYAFIVSEPTFLKMLKETNDPTLRMIEDVEVTIFGEEDAPQLDLNPPSSPPASNSKPVTLISIFCIVLLISVALIGAVIYVYVYKRRRERKKYEKQFDSVKKNDTPTPKKSNLGKHYSRTRETECFDQENNNTSLFPVAVPPSEISSDNYDFSIGGSIEDVFSLEDMSSKYTFSSKYTLGEVSKIAESELNDILKGENAVISNDVWNDAALPSFQLTEDTDNTSLYRDSSTIGDYSYDKTKLPG